MRQAGFHSGIAGIRARYWSVPSGRAACVLLILTFMLSSARGQEKVTGVGAIGMTVSDMQRSVEFFSKVLTFEQVSDVEVWGDAYEHLEGIFGVRMRVVRMKLGTEAVELTEYLTPKGKPFPADTKSNDRWFQHVAIVTSDMDKAYEHLRKFNVRHASTGPQTLPPTLKAAAGIRAFYFRDPDGHYLEIIWFPADKRDPRWNTPADKLFLGIDHTAIVVASTEESLKFYRDRLGLRVAGESENYGTEQEHLNNVFGARLHITGLRAPAGPGIEFLEYLTPRDGRPAPADMKANDIAHWQTSLLTADASAIESQLRIGPSIFVSPAAVATDGRLGFGRALLVEDPDGHSMNIMEGRETSDTTGTSNRKEP
jgi:catechol 2,3-dioxygenase-like lactoylglutathione lyase family enzyme